jgi:N-acyl-D-aspartate/D-glutamate deacylase
VARGGTIADSRGGELFEADIGIVDCRIAQVGAIARAGKDEISHCQGIPAVMTAPGMSSTSSINGISTPLSIDLDLC